MNIGCTVTVQGVYLIHRRIRPMVSAEMLGSRFRPFDIHVITTLGYMSYLNLQATHRDYRDFSQ